MGNVRGNRRMGAVVGDVEEVIIDRTTDLGNPFKLVDVRDDIARDAVCDAYEELIRQVLSAEDPRRVDVHNIALRFGERTPQRAPLPIVRTPQRDFGRPEAMLKLRDALTRLEAKVHRNIGTLGGPLISCATAGGNDAMALRLSSSWRGGFGVGKDMQEALHVEIRLGQWAEKMAKALRSWEPGDMGIMRR